MKEFFEPSICISPADIFISIVGIIGCFGQLTIAYLLRKERKRIEKETAAKNEKIKKYLLSEEYLEFASKMNVTDLTNSQVSFVEWALKKDNAKVIASIGDMESMFRLVRKYVKDR